MPNVIKSIKTFTKDGEITINLNLNLDLKIQSDGTVQVTSTGTTTEKEKEKEKIDWVVPEFQTNKIINFGKEV